MRVDFEPAPCMSSFARLVSTRSCPRRCRVSDRNPERVSVEISESLPPVQTDPDLLERVVANLVENAVTWSDRQDRQGQRRARWPVGSI